MGNSASLSVSNICCCYDSPTETTEQSFQKILLVQKKEYPDSFQLRAQANPESYRSLNIISRGPTSSRTSFLNVSIQKFYSRMTKIKLLLKPFEESLKTDTVEFGCPFDYNDFEYLVAMPFVYSGVMFEMECFLGANAATITFVEEDTKGKEIFNHAIYRISEDLQKNTINHKKNANLKFSQFTERIRVIDEVSLSMKVKKYCFGYQFRNKLGEFFFGICIVDFKSSLDLLIEFKRERIIKILKELEEYVAMIKEIKVFLFTDVIEVEMEIFVEKRDEMQKYWMKCLKSNVSVGKLNCLRFESEVLTEIGLRNSEGEFWMNLDKRKDSRLIKYN